MNSLDPNIKFTQEQCTNNMLPFLDCLVKINSNGSLSTSVFCKPTHTDQYLQFSSHHPLIHKLGVVRTLEHRANTLISDPDELQKEKEHIRKALNLCGYPNWAFHKASLSQREYHRQVHEQRAGPSVSRNIRITIPYIAGVSDAIKSTFRTFGISTSFKPCNTLRQKLVNVKDKPRKEKIYIYSMLYMELNADQRTAVKHTLEKLSKHWAREWGNTKGLVQSRLRTLLFLTI